LTPLMLQDEAGGLHSLWIKMRLPNSVCMG